MSLVEKVTMLIRDADIAGKDKSSAIENAEKLADKYKDVKPQSFSIPMEKLHRLPTFHNKNFL